MKTIYEIRKAGREYCQTEGSEHYKAVDKLEPIDLIIAKGLAEDFCLANIIKYASRFKQTQKLEDLKKVSDYLHILCGVKLQEPSKIEWKFKDDILKTTESEYKTPSCHNGVCTDKSIKTRADVRLCYSTIFKFNPAWDKGCYMRRVNK